LSVFNKEGTYANHSSGGLCRSCRFTPGSDEEWRSSRHQHRSQEQRIPPSFLAKIISQLSIAGLLHTSRGARGGVMLARDPKDITLLEVVEAIDGPIQLNECVADDGVCSFDESCPIRSVWCEAQEDLVARLRQTDFGQLLAKSAQS
jgi:Rrf2 family protein